MRVARDSITVGHHSVDLNRSSWMMQPPVRIIPMLEKANAFTWFSGKGVINRSTSGCRLQRPPRSRYQLPKVKKYWLDSTQPFGRPVLPDVKTIAAPSGEPPENLFGAALGAPWSSTACGVAMAKPPIGCVARSAAAWSSGRCTTRSTSPCCNRYLASWAVRLAPIGTTPAPNKQQHNRRPRPAPALPIPHDGSLDGAARLFVRQVHEPASAMCRDVQ